MAILELVRKAALPAIWSQGVKLARENAITRESSDTYRVKSPGFAVPPTVTLYVDDGEWSCDCGGKADPCAHVCAAAIATSQGEVQATAETSPHIAYRLAVREGRLVMTRLVGDAPIRGSLASGVLRGGLAPTHDDMKIDRIVGVTSRDVLPLERIAEIFEGLEAASDVSLDGAKIVVRSERLKPHAIVEDAANGGLTLRVEADPQLVRVLALGVALVRDGNTEVLRPLGETSTTGERLERLPLVRTFSRNEETELVTRVLPELEKKIEVTVRTKRLAKKSIHARPRIEMDLSHHGHTLSVMPTLVYGDPPIARIDGDKVTALGGDVPVRRLEQEHAMLQRLRTELDLVPGRRVHFDGAEAAKFAARLRDFQDLLGEHEHAAVFEGEALVPNVLASDDGTFDVMFVAEGKQADSSVVLRAWRDGLDLVPLEGGGWSHLPTRWLAEHGARALDLLAARDPDTKKLPGSANLELARLCEELDMPPPAAVDKLRPLVADDFERIPSYALPSDLRADLRPYQQRGVDWLAFLRSAGLGAVLADDMGLGKTLQTIATLAKAPARTLVVCPKSVVYNWQAEITRFRPELRVAVYHGARRELDPDAEVTLTTYAMLRLDPVLGEKTWDAVVLDEAQAIKNETSQTARAAFALKADFKVALSGTPVENRLEELWSLMNFTNAGMLGGRSSFHDRYVAPIASGDQGAADRLRAKIRPLLLRRLKRDVLPELPPRTDTVLHVELEESERVIYDAVRAASKKDLLEKLSGTSEPNVLAALEALLRLRQAACHPALLPGQHAESSSKVEALVATLEEAVADGHKALVFSQWTSLLDLVEPHLDGSGIGFVRLDGQTADRAGVVSKFQAEGGPPVMLASLKAGGTGLNLTAADHVFLLDPWWNPAAEDQAADRAHRIGQDRPVIVYRMVAKDTVEERILALQEKKRALADVALGDAAARGNMALTRADLLALLD